MGCKRDAASRHRPHSTMTALMSPVTTHAVTRTVRPRLTAFHSTPLHCVIRPSLVSLLFMYSL